MSGADEAIENKDKITHGEATYMDVFNAVGRTSVRVGLHKKKESTGQPLLHVFTKLRDALRDEQLKAHLQSKWHIRRKYLVTRTEQKQSVRLLLRSKKSRLSAPAPP